MVSQVHHVFSQTSNAVILIAVNQSCVTNAISISLYARARAAAVRIKFLVYLKIRNSTTSQEVARVTMEKILVEPRDGTVASCLSNLLQTSADDALASGDTFKVGLSGKALPR